MIATLCVVAAGCLLFTASASASTIKVPTDFTKFKLKTTSSGLKFSGKIDAGTNKCVNNRKVKLVRKKNGNEKKLGSDSTDSDGKFKMKVNASKAGKGKYYAKVKNKSYDKGGDTYKCKKAESGSITVS